MRERRGKWREGLQVEKESECPGIPVAAVDIKQYDEEAYQSSNLTSLCVRVCVCVYMCVYKHKKQETLVTVSCNRAAQHLDGVWLL